MDAFSRTILDWYAANGRDLPWRRTQNPYAVWLSEIILQQTRIAQGTAYWQRFMERFPTVEDLAQASEDEVLRLWEGLGYYSRARNLHAAARQIVALGAFPDTLEGIRALKGVGDYTAAAIGSICFGLPAAVVDGNVYRVLARHFGLATPVGTPQAKKEFTALAQKLLPEAEASAFNQGMMDFGALHGSTAIRKRGPGDIWQGLYEPLAIESPTASGVMAEENYFSQGFAKNQFSSSEIRLLHQGMKHQLTHRTLICDFYLWEPADRPELPEGYFWIKEAELDHYGKPRLFELLIQEVEKTTL